MRGDFQTSDKDTRIFSTNQSTLLHSRMEVEKSGAQSFQAWSKARLAEGRPLLWRQLVMFEFPQSVTFGYPQLNRHPYRRLEMLKQ